jgi:hypothetical protein
MVSYQVEGTIVAVTLAGTYRPHDLTDILEAVHRDPAVRAPILFLIDASQSQVRTSPGDAWALFDAMLERLGTRIGPAFALVPSPYGKEGVAPTVPARSRAVRGPEVRLFDDAAAARVWLSDHVAPGR